MKQKVIIISSILLIVSIFIITVIQHNNISHLNIGKEELNDIYSDTFTVEKSILTDIVNLFNLLLDDEETLPTTTSTRLQTCSISFKEKMQNHYNNLMKYNDFKPCEYYYVIFPDVLCNIVDVINKSGNIEKEKSIRILNELNTIVDLYVCYDKQAEKVDSINELNQAIRERLPKIQDAINNYNKQ